VLAHIVVVDFLLDQQAAVDVVVDRSGRSVRHDEQWLAVDLADDATVDLDYGVRSDHLDVEHLPVRLDRCDHLTQDVHDVLRVDSSE
jgi:hypothetical protein